MSRFKMIPRTKIRHARPKGQIQIGAPPGVLSIAQDSLPAQIHVMAYDAQRLVDKQVDDLNEIPRLFETFNVVWVNVVGLENAQTLEQLAEMVHLHPLALEDVVNVFQRAKVEPYEENVFIVARIPHAEEQLKTEQISCVLGPNYLLTFQQFPGDCFDGVRARLRNQRPRIRGAKPDYLLYALLDATVDSYFPIVESLADRLEELEDDIMRFPTQRVMEQVHEIRSALRLLSRAFRPHREALNSLIREENALIHPSTAVFLRDCYDHTVQLIELMEVYRDLCHDLRDYHMSIVSSRMNEVMKVLTIIATIFIPLGFIAGVYGMNFDDSSPMNMPELHWAWGYPFVLALMGIIALGMIGYFWRMGWIGERSAREV